MQDRYVGDIGDYAKYGMLRALSSGYRLGVAWYRCSNETHNSDGKHTRYLEDATRWRGFDPELFDALKQIVDQEKRCLTSIEKSDLLRGARFASETLTCCSPVFAERAEWRKQWGSRFGVKGALLAGTGYSLGYAAGYVSMSYGR